MEEKKRRERYPMPDWVKLALNDEGRTEDFEARPEYQRNDYLGWISSGKLPATRQKRLRQMLDELEEGGVYMKMDHAPSRKKSK